ncbi:hypothetical protein CPB84DRAFT_1790287 [Gymnopilus junonius]|uniref:Uncharacterized protein n=1 Tax=Gymnopilus junonius TaxID=109634 RepID=A0A9P5NGC0_GYMJU|nr:hypothetical protein CPB84DRAFT_1790287 [Gymnopilus junonius]
MGPGSRQLSIALDREEPPTRSVMRLLAVVTSNSDSPVPGVDPQASGADTPPGPTTELRK